MLTAGHAFGETTELLPGLVRGARGQDRARHLPQHHGQPGDRLGHRRGRRADGARRLPRRLSDHAGQRRAARGRALPALRREDVPGRGRDRGGLLRDRRGLRGSARGHGLERPRLRAEAGGARPRGHDGAAAASSINVQRAGPSTGLPTKTEQGDLLCVALRPALREPDPDARGRRRRATASSRCSRPSSSP